MRKPSNRIEKRPQPLEVDEEAVRTAFLAGEKPKTIRARLGGRDGTVAIQHMIAENGERWLMEARTSRLVEDDRRIVISRRTSAGVWGGVAHVKISLPRISMHVAALAEAGQ